jgi:DNA-binding CsgD family transcriptional regulator
MLKISRDHPTLQMKGKIQAIVAPFLKQHGFNYFQYLRCFNDGSCSTLTNHTGLFEVLPDYSDKPVIFSSFTQEHEKLHSYWFLWDEELPAFPVQLAKDKFNLHNGITLVRRSKNYYDMIAVALPAARSNIASFYLTKQKAIESFIQTFDQNHQDLLQFIGKNPLVLPPDNRDVNYQKICLPNGRIQVTGNHGLSYITAQELACVRLLLQGATSKQIGKMLNISHRTVETYLLRVKQRTGVSSKTGLTDLISLSTY